MFTSEFEFLILTTAPKKIGGPPPFEIVAVRLNTRPTATRKKTKKNTIIQDSYKKKRDCCPPFTTAHKLTTVVVVLTSTYR